MAFIEASLEELPVSTKLGQSCLATKISAPGPSSFGWFRHRSLHNRRRGPMGRHHVPWLRQWGPRARSADQVGRSACRGHQPPPTSSGRLSWASLSGPRWGWPILTSFGLVLGLHLVHLSLNRYSDIFCDFLLGQSVLATYILAQKHILHILEVKCGLGIYLDKDACKKCKLS